MGLTCQPESGIIKKTRKENTMNEAVIQIRRPKSNALSPAEDIIEKIESMTNWMREKEYGYAVEVGQELIKLKAEAKAEGLKWAEVCERLPFSQQHANRFMSIAENEALSNLTHVLNIPADTNTLYQLSRIPAPQLEQYIEGGQVKPDMSRAEASALVKGKAKPKPKAEQPEPDNAREKRRSNLADAWKRAAPSDREWFFQQNRAWFEKRIKG